MRFHSILSLALLSLLALPVLAQQPPAPPLRLRGEITKVEGNHVTLKTRSGESLSIMLAEKVAITGVKKAEFSEVSSGKFVGIASRPQPDGTHRALEVLVFPEASRGSNEGHYPWDLTSDSMMTNANISSAVEAKEGRNLTLHYKDKAGKETDVKVHVPVGTPVVTFVPADMAKIVPGAKVLVVANKGADGMLTSPRVLVGIDITPPM